MTWTKVDYDVALEVASHEAIVRQSYKDSVGVWTWSVGLTRNTGHNVKRYIGKPQPLEYCLKIYIWALNNYAEQVRVAFKGCELTKAQFAAALSFHWNTGSILKASWVRKFKAGDIAGARRAFMAYRKPPEIIGRRRKERDLFFDGKWSNDGTMTEFTRLTSRSTPMWSSGKKINVKKELRAAFSGAGNRGPEEITRIPPPQQGQDGETASPKGQGMSKGEKGGLGAAVGTTLLGGIAAWLGDNAVYLIGGLAVAVAICVVLVLMKGKKDD